jgi:ribosomal protein S1
VEITFLGGITGTCFADHLDEENGLNKLKIGSKVNARIISVDPVSKVITVSMKKNIVGWSTKYVESTLNHLKVGQKFENVKVQSQLYGDSYLINLQKDGLKGFLHKT